MEILNSPAGRRFACALLDFDGTISLIREGWQDVMAPMDLEILRPLRHGLSERQLSELVTEDITSLTGKQTIYQMIRLAERVKEFGGEPEPPAEYKRRYGELLMQRIGHRREALAAGTAQPEQMLLRGARRLLELLAAAGLELFLASGTDEHYVRQEAALLKVDGFFTGGIYGAHGASLADSKEAVIRRLLGERRLGGAELLCFGDGFVEIDAVKAVGGYAVGVASDEAAGGGEVDPWKRDRLIKAGADMIVPDFAQTEQLVKLLLGDAVK